MINEEKKSFYLAVIVVSQFFCTSLWFASNGVMDELIASFNLSSTMLGNLTSSVQFGFIVGTLLIAIFRIADRFHPSYVFAVSALLGALANLGLVWEVNSALTLLLGRFLTGVFLAGIYPIGMKIAADHFGKGLGKSLGFLVGALVLGTALPHLLKEITQWISWESVLYLTSALALLGGILMWAFVPEGELRTVGKNMEWSAFLSVFKDKSFRTAAFGYFGHMWELYAFWAFVPILLQQYGLQHQMEIPNLSFLSFTVIGVGMLSCVLGGYISTIKGPEWVARNALTLSLFSGLMVPFMLLWAPFITFYFFLLFWGMVVIADSPMFSTLVAQTAPTEKKGTALTIVNCLGFAISIISIQALSILNDTFYTLFLYWVLLLGPIIGVTLLYINKRKTSHIL